MTDCILVGNGTSVMETEHGQAIDAHKTVCRFNDVHIPGYECHVGTKTDVWFTCLKFNPAKLDQLQPCSRIVVHSWQRAPEKCQTFDGYRHLLPAASKLDHMLIDEVCAYMGRNDYRSWSTGALAIWMMLKEQKRVIITGFDWWERGPEQHHYADKAVRGALHKPEREYDLVMKLQADGRLSFLV